MNLLTVGPSDPDEAALNVAVEDMLLSVKKVRYHFLRGDVLLQFFEKLGEDIDVSLHH